MFTLPERLRELRISHGYQQADVAAVLGVIRQTYSHYENGKRVPSAAALKKLADLYQIHPRTKFFPPSISPTSNAQKIKPGFGLSAFRRKNAVLF